MYTVQGRLHLVYAASVRPEPIRPHQVRHSRSVNRRVNQRELHVDVRIGVPCAVLAHHPCSSDIYPAG